MRTLIVEIDRQFVQEGLRTGYIVKHMAISKGLPDDALLTEVYLNPAGILTLTFQSETEGEDVTYVCISITTLS